MSGAANDHESVLEQLRAVVAAPRGQAPSLRELEHVLTTGYASAHALEAERWRLQRRVTELAGGVRAGGDVQLHASDLAGAADRISEVERELDVLRPLLVAVRRRADEIRSAA